MTPTLTKTRMIIIIQGYRAVSQGPGRKRLRTPLKLYVTKVSWGRENLIAKYFWS